MLGRKEQREDVERRGPLREALEEGLARLAREARELAGAPALAEEAHEGTAGTALEVRVADVVGEGELEGARGSAGALPAAAAAGAPLAASDVLILGKVKEGVEETVHHLLDDAGLDLVIEGVDGEVGGRTHDVEGGIEVVASVGEDEGAGVYVAEGKVEGGGGKGRGGEVEREGGVLRGFGGGPAEELVVEVG